MVAQRPARARTAAMLTAPAVFGATVVIVELAVELGLEVTVPLREEPPLGWEEPEPDPEPDPDEEEDVEVETALV